jgi:uncharacterized membrane protein
MGPARRTAVYTATGFVVEVLFSALHDAARGKKVRFRTSAWMLPIYALIKPLYEPLHDRIRSQNALVRATTYGLGFLAVEYATGRLIRETRGTAPWDYSYASRHIDGLIRPDYFFLWAGAGLALERLDDRLRLDEPRIEEQP